MAGDRPIGISTSRKAEKGKKSEKLWYWLSGTQANDLS